MAKNHSKSKTSPATDATGADATGADATKPKPVAGPSNAMLALFAPRPGAGMLALKGLKRRNSPGLIKPTDIPIGGVLSGVIMDAIDSHKTTIKGKLLWLRLVTFSADGSEVLDSGKEITFPCTGVIRNALVPDIKSDASGDLLPALRKLKGQLLVATRLDNKISQYDKEMTMWDIFTGDSPIDIEVNPA